MAHHDPADWLRTVLAESARLGHCVREGCTTCGAMPFATLLQTGAAAVAGREPKRGRYGGYLGLNALKHSGVLDTLVSALARLDGVDLSTHSEPLRLLARRRSLYLGSDGTLSPPLAGTPFGDLVLTCLEADRHHAMERARRAMVLQDQQAAAKARKVAEAEARQEAHLQRLAVKAERDALWRQRQLSAGATLETPQAVALRRQQRKARRLAARGSSAKNRM